MIEGDRENRTNSVFKVVEQNNETILWQTFSMNKKYPIKLNISS